jgi:hypothetical protein
MSKITYSVADGYVLRGDEPIAQYYDGQLTFLAGKEQYRAPVVRYLREQNLAADVAPVRPGEELPTDPSAPRLPEPVDVEAEVGKVMATSAYEVMQRALEGTPIVREMLDAQAGKIFNAVIVPKGVKVYIDAPLMTPEEGEKTPAFARWLIANHPEDARSRSALRKFFQ